MNHLGVIGLPALDDLLPRLLASPHLQRLTHVHLAFCELTDPDTLRGLQRAPAAAQHLTHLTLRGIDVSVAHARALLDPDLTAPLTHLALIDAYVEDPDLDALLDSPRLQRLTHLLLPHSYLSPAALQRLAAAAPRLPDLQRLDLRDNHLPTDHPTLHLLRATYGDKLLI